MLFWKNGENSNKKTNLKDFYSTAELLGHGN